MSKKITVQIKQVMLTDLIGRRVAAPFINNVLDVSALAQGEYIIHVLLNDQWMTSKIVRL